MRSAAMPPRLYYEAARPLGVRTILQGVSDDRLRAARERARANSFWRFLGIEVDEAGEGWVRLRLAVRDELRNAPGAPVHGGVLSALVDAAVGGALGTLHAQGAGGVGQTTVDLNVSFLAPATEGELLAEGRILRRGRTLAFGEGRVTDTGGRLLAVGRATYMILARP
jgi:uncharacterized protein (TIGR00369 family)